MNVSLILLKTKWWNMFS